jgi:hypothetical protein
MHIEQSRREQDLLEEAIHKFDTAAPELATLCLFEAPLNMQLLDVGYGFPAPPGAVEDMRALGATDAAYIDSLDMDLVYNRADASYNLYELIVEYSGGVTATTNQPHMRVGRDDFFYMHSVLQAKGRKVKTLSHNTPVPITEVQDFLGESGIHIDEIPHPDGLGAILHSVNTASSRSVNMTRTVDIDDNLQIAVTETVEEADPLAARQSQTRGKNIVPFSTIPDDATPSTDTEGLSPVLQVFDHSRHISIELIHHNKKAVQSLSAVLTSASAYIQPKYAVSTTRSVAANGNISLFDVPQRPIDHDAAVLNRILHGLRVATGGLGLDD